MKKDLINNNDENSKQVQEIEKSFIIGILKNCDISEFITEDNSISFEYLERKQVVEE